MCWDILMKATERLKAYSGLSARDSKSGRPEWEAEVLVRRLFRAVKWHESNCVHLQHLDRKFLYEYDYVIILNVWHFESTVFIWRWNYMFLHNVKRYMGQRVRYVWRIIILLWVAYVANLRKGSTAGNVYATQWRAVHLSYNV
jgi:hypothetical protein